jgi:hypothetical protein
MLPLSKSLLFTACCALGLALPGRTLAQNGTPEGEQEVLNGLTSTSAVPVPRDIASVGLPDSPGTSWVKAQDASNLQTAASQTATPSTPQTSASQLSQATSAQDQSAPDQSPKPQRPVGTAAAEAPKGNGVTAAQPAGVAIAPAKQRRVRTIVLRVGAIVGAGVALGSVIALTAGTPSKPPGAH